LYVLVTNTPSNGTGGIVYKLVPIRVKAQLSGNTLEVSWPTIAGHLESRANFSTGDWIPVPGSATTNRVVIPIDPSSGSTFYRLALP
jgi:hypothetical protein